MLRLCVGQDSALSPDGATAVAFWQAGEARRAARDTGEVNAFLSQVIKSSDPMAAGLEIPLGVAVDAAAGRIERPVTAALLDQAAAILKPDETLIEAWGRLNPEGTPNDAHAALARFLFRNTAAHRTVGTLSGGERLRAALACVMTGAKPPQLLILDEPTNHLDLESIAAIEAALAAYDGALVVVSHDRDFLSNVGVDREVRLERADCTVR